MTTGLQELQTDILENLGTWWHEVALLEVAAQLSRKEQCHCSEGSEPFYIKLSKPHNNFLKRWYPHFSDEETEALWGCSQSTVS